VSSTSKPDVASGDVSDREKRFFDHSYASGVREAVSRFYVVSAARSNWYLQTITSHCGGKRVLEYGCGEGASAFALVGHAAEVVGIDISDVAVAHANRRASEACAASLRFQRMDAERMEFEPASFDVVCGSGILHHLEIGRALREIARVLKPDGIAVFLEPMGHNPLINLFRWLTPGLRTRDEHPLVVRDLQLAKRIFNHVECRFFNLFSMAAYLLRGHAGFTGALHRLDTLDRRVFRWAPSLALMAWFVVIVMRAPRVRWISDVAQVGARRSSCDDDLSRS
jgi:SAM-dependent methyltransferase